MTTESAELGESRSDPAARDGSHSSRLRGRGVTAVYLLGLGVSISLWFLAIRSPLWLDETWAYWQIGDGFSKIWPRQFDAIAFPSYAYILWLSTKVLGTSEVALRVPSVIAMLGAAYLLYLAARKLFERGLAILVTTIFCLYSIVSFAAIDVHPYAFAVLAINATILLLFKLRHDDSNWLPALIGVLAALVISFQFLFAVFVPAVVICFFAVKDADRKIVWRQLGVAAIAFLLAFIPLVPGFLSLFQTRQSHIWAKAPNALDLVFTLAPGWMMPILGVVLFLALLIASWHRPYPPRDSGSWRLIVCLSLAVIPLFILYAVSFWAPLFVARHRLVAVPGIALLWGLVFERWLIGPLRLLFCFLLVAVSAFYTFRSPEARRHGVITWKYALQATEANASVDGAPVLMCSNFSEADYAPMPNDPKDSNFFAPLSYYKLSVPVVPLPVRLNGEAIREATGFLAQAIPRHERFLAVGAQVSSGTLEWIAQQTSTTYDVHRIGVFDGVAVWEFRPKA